MTDLQLLDFARADDASPAGVDPFLATVSHVVTTCAVIFEVRAENILSKSRAASLTPARNAAWMILRHQGHTYQTIGDAFKRGHSGILHGCLAGEKLFKSSPAYSTRVKEALNQLSTPAP